MLEESLAQSTSAEDYEDDNDDNLAQRRRRSIFSKRNMRKASKFGKGAFKFGKEVHQSGLLKPYTGGLF